MYSVHITDIAEEDILATVKYIADALKAPIASYTPRDPGPYYYGI
jgi:hypothetical protein